MPKVTEILSLGPTAETCVARACEARSVQRGGHFPQHLLQTTMPEVTEVLPLGPTAATCAAGVGGVAVIAEVEEASLMVTTVLPLGTTASL